MMSLFFLGRDAFIDFSVHVTGITLIVPALLWLWFGEHESQNRKTYDSEKLFDSSANTIFWLVVITLTFIIAPGTSYIIQKTIGDQQYINTLIAIPTVLVSVYSYISFTKAFSFKGKKLIISSFCFCILILTSSSIFMTYDHSLGIELLSNKMKISPEVQEICNHTGPGLVMLPEELYGQIHEYDSGIEAQALTGSKNDYNYAEDVVKQSTDAGATYFVIKKSYNDSAIINSYHFSEAATTDHYIVYQQTEE